MHRFASPNHLPASPRGERRGGRRALLNATLDHRDGYIYIPTYVRLSTIPTTPFSPRYDFAAEWKKRRKKKKKKARRGKKQTGEEETCIGRGPVIPVAGTGSSSTVFRFFFLVGRRGESNEFTKNPAKLYQIPA